MKNFNKLFGGILLAFGLMGLVSVSQATSSVVSPKTSFELSYTTTITTVTAIASTNAATNAAFNPGAVYQVILATGTSGDYFQMYDSTAATNVTTCGQVTALTGTATLLGPRFYFGSTSQNSSTKIDPPIVFLNGLVVCVSSTADQASVTYELGRGISGQ